MAMALIEESPLVLPSELGTYRRRDYEELSEQPRCELLFGRFYVTPSPTLRHQAIAELLAEHLRSAAEKAGGLVFLAPLDVTLADHSVVQPDVIYVSAAREQILRERVEGAPDLLVEVLSPGSARRDREEKLSLYAQSGVREYWIVDPIERQIEFLVNEEGRFVVCLPVDGAYRSRALPEICLDLTELWQKLETRLPRKTNSPPSGRPT